MRKEKNKTYIFGKIAFSFLVVLVFMGFRAPKAEAALWPAIDPIVRTGLAEIAKLLNGMIMGQIKLQVAKHLNAEVDVLLSGGSSGNAAFITDWEDYLISSPENKTVAYMNDYLSQTTSGRGSLTGYESEGFSGGYSAKLKEGARNKLEQKQKTAKVTYEGDPSKMFESGNFKNFNRFLAGINNPWAYDINTQREYQEKLEEERQISQTKAGAYQGFQGSVDKNGNVTYPGSLIKEDVANIRNIPNAIIASATSIPEIISSVVSQTITKSIQKGFSGVQRSFQADASAESRINSNIESAINQSGPGARFDMRVEN